MITTRVFSEGSSFCGVEWDTKRKQLLFFVVNFCWTPTCLFLLTFIDADWLCRPAGTV